MYVCMCVHYIRKVHLNSICRGKGNLLYIMYGSIRSTSALCMQMAMVSRDLAKCLLLLVFYTDAADVALAASAGPMQDLATDSKTFSISVAHLVKAHCQKEKRGFLMSSMNVTSRPHG